MDNCAIPPQPFRDTCGLQAPNLDVYKGACGALTDRQFEFNDIRGYNSTGGGSRRSNLKSRRKIYKKNMKISSRKLSRKQNRRSSRKSSRKISKKSKRSQRNRRQRGGAYTFNLSERIGGLPAVAALPDTTPPTCYPPHIQKGGKMHYLTRNMNSQSFVNGFRNKSQSNSSSSSSSYNQQQGGMMDFNEAYRGQMSVFTDDMMKRSFDCRQPDWTTKCT